MDKNLPQSSGKSAQPAGRARDLAYPLRIVVGVIFIVIVSLTIAQVFARSVLDSPLIWSEEMVRLLLVWMVFLGAAVVTWDGRHLNVDVVFARLPRTLQRILRWINRLIALAFVSVVAVTSWKLVMLERFSEIGALTISMAWVRVPATIGCGLMVVLLLARVFYRQRVEPPQAGSVDPI